MTGHRRFVAWSLAVVVLVLVGALLVRCDRPAPDRSSSTGQSAGPEPGVADESGAEAGGGPVEAAVAYTAASQRWLYATDEDIRSEVEELSTPRAAEGNAAEVLAAVGRARGPLAESSGRIWWLVHPMATRVASYGGYEAQVEVWTVTVLSAADVAAPQVEWSTATLDLEWVGDRWLVGRTRTAPGPTPVPGPTDDPWDAGDFDTAMEGFTRLDGEPLA